MRLRLAADRVGSKKRVWDDPTTEANGVYRVDLGGLRS